MQAVLLELEGLRCGGCVRAVEARLRQHPGVQQASVNLLQRTAWVELDPAALEPLLASLAASGYPAHRRDDEDPTVSLAERRQARGWWQQWHQLLVALLLLLVSGAGHLSHAQATHGGHDHAPLPLLAQFWLHGLVATLALAGPGRPILWNGARGLLAGVPTMDSLVGLGLASAYGASAVGFLWPQLGWPCFFNEPVMLLGFVLLGRFIEERARFRTGQALQELAALQPDQALLLCADGTARPVRTGGLRPGDRIQLLAGDRVPVDAVVLEGSSSLDTSSLTGESLPRPVAVGQELAAGCLNLEATLVLEVRRSGGESAVARIIHLVQQAQARKAPIQGLADRVAGRFVWIVLALALGTAVFWGQWGVRLWPEVLQSTGQSPLSLALELAIAVLVVACPCALGLATPTAITVGAGLAARAGRLFRGGEAIEIASRLRTIAFDKTGTLTRGAPEVTAITPLASPGGTPSPESVLQLAASLEQQSRHPLARSLVEAARDRGLVLLPLVAAVRTLAGRGLEGRLGDREEGPAVRVGRLDWLLDGLPLLETEAAAARLQQQLLEQDGATVVAVAEGPRLLGLVAIADSPRADALATVQSLRRRGLRLAVLSGDRRQPVEALAQPLGLPPEDLAWELLPEQKLERLERLQQAGPVAMVGDGINDAPALAAADLGVAVGSGTQIAQDTADLVVLGDRLLALPLALELADRTMAKVRQNLIWAFGYNLVLLPIAAGVLLPGYGLMLSPPLAALLMASSSITVVLNALLLQHGPVPRPS
ncbi:MAG: heavy metal translocating P-type ATPase [Cyanobacteriota bacterium]